MTSVDRKTVTSDHDACRMSLPESESALIDAAAARVAAEAPPLDPDQRARLAVLLRPTNGTGGTHRGMAPAQPPEAA